MSIFLIANVLALPRRFSRILLRAIFNLLGDSKFRMDGLFKLISETLRPKGTKNIMGDIPYGRRHIVCRLFAQSADGPLANNVIGLLWIHPLGVRSYLVNPAFRFQVS